LFYKFKIWVFEEQEGRFYHKTGTAEGLFAFKEAQATSGLQIITLVWYAFISKEFQSIKKPVKTL